VIIGIGKIYITGDLAAYKCIGQTGIVLKLNLVLMNYSHGEVPVWIDTPQTPNGFATLSERWTDNGEYLHCTSILKEIKEIETYEDFALLFQELNQAIQREEDIAKTKRLLILLSNYLQNRVETIPSRT
jgi:hypothetical protein